MITTENWLYIEPFVYIAVNSDKALLYNTLNGKSVEFSYNTKPYFLIKRLNQDKNLMVVKLSSNYQNDLEICNFVNKIQKFYIGDILNMPFRNGKKPFQLKPIYNIQRDLKAILQKESFGTKVMQQITDISIQINAACRLNCNNCNNYHKQFLSCTQNSKSEMGLQTIKKIFEDLAGANITNINISGGNVFEYSHFEGLIEVLKEYYFSASFFTHYKNIPLKDNVLNLLSKYNHKINSLIFLPVDIEILKTKLYLLEKNKINSCHTFIIENYEDYFVAENLNKELQMDNSVFFPFYNEKNITFFKENVFLLKKDILEAMPTIAIINSRKMINSNYYGKLVIMANGDVYANVNEKKLGNINNGSLHEFANREMKDGNSWCKTRNNIMPCKTCVYKYLCPPISSYEYNIGKYNMCKINR